MSAIRRYVPSPIKSNEDYIKWLTNLKKHDACLVQQFMPVRDGVLDLPFEHWRFYTAEYLEDEVRYGGSLHPIRPDGLCCYWNTNSPWGEVFAARLVPTHSDFKVNADDYYAIACEPMFEPAYTDNYDNFRCFFLNSYGEDNAKGYLASKLFRYSYTRKVQGGYLITAFGDFKELQKLVKNSPLVYLYSERIDSKC